MNREVRGQPRGQRSTERSVVNREVEDQPRGKGSTDICQGSIERSRIQISAMAEMVVEVSVPPKVQL